MDNQVNFGTLELIFCFCNVLTLNFLLSFLNFLKESSTSYCALLCYTTHNSHTAILTRIDLMNDTSHLLEYVQPDACRDNKLLIQMCSISLVLFCSIPNQLIETCGKTPSGLWPLLFQALLALLTPPCVCLGFRVANLYFLFLVVLNWVPLVEAFQKEITMLPLMVVLTIIAIKDGLDDYRKYKIDKQINNLVTKVYSR